MRLRVYGKFALLAKMLINYKFPPSAYNYIGTHTKIIIEKKMKVPNGNVGSGNDEEKEREKSCKIFHV